MVSPGRSGANTDVEGTWEHAWKQKHVISNATKDGLKLDLQLPNARDLIRHQANSILHFFENGCLVVLLVRLCFFGSNDI